MFYNRSKEKSFARETSKEDDDRQDTVRSIDLILRLCNQVPACCSNNKCSQRQK